MNDIAKLTELADQLFEAQTKVVEMEADLKEAQRAVRQLEEHDLPEAMSDMGVEELKTSTGLVVTVKTDLHAKKLTQAHERALAWLRDRGQGGLIKTLVGVPFTAGSEADADQLVDRLQGDGILAMKTMEVHHSSLGAALRKIREAGEDVPDFLGAYEVTKAKVRPAK